MAIDKGKTFAVIVNGVFRRIPAFPGGLDMLSKAELRDFCIALENQPQRVMLSKRLRFTALTI
jgi:hypothetical protein